MKRDAVLSCLCGWLLGTVLSFAAVGCLITAFDLPGVSMPVLLALCVLFSAAGAVCFRFRWGGAALLAGLAVAAFLLWREEEPVGQTLWVVEKISRVYDGAYHWGWLELGGSEGAVYPMAALAGLIALTVSGTVSRGVPALPGMTVSLLPLLFCLVVTDTVPDALYLFLLMSGLAVLVLTAAARRRSPEQGNLLTALVLIPAVLASLLLLLLNPQESYVNRLPDVRQLVTQWVEKLPQRVLELPQYFEEMRADGQPSLPDDQTNRVDLSKVGPQTQSHYPIMDVLGTMQGTLYLRGQDFDLYSGKGWQSSSRQEELFPGPGAGLRHVGSVTVETRRLRDLQYLPYYPVGGKYLLSGRRYNTTGLYRYTVSVGALDETWRSRSAGAPGVILNDAQRHSDGEALARYGGLPDRTRQQGQAIVQTLVTGQESRAETAAAIAEFVRGSARYDLNTPSMPGTEKDFAIWFLEDSETGYCVHFATAATVLLRAADIPARYVTGYMVEVVSGEAVTVTAEHAHAWVEYYEPVLDAWIVLEATPSAQPDRTEPESTQEETGATQTEEPEPESTGQTEETKPEETKPEETTLPATEPEETVSDPTQDTAEPEETEPVSVPGWPGALAGWILVLGAVVLLVQEQRVVRLAAKRRRFREGDANTQALRRWREAVVLAKLCGDGKPPRPLERLAQKAKFSQHILTDGELALLQEYLQQCIQHLREKPWYWQLVYRYLYALF